jgi:hypothetical protein
MKAAGGGTGVSRISHRGKLQRRPQVHARFAAEGDGRGRAAADPGEEQMESDPELRKRLWDEYRKYRQVISQGTGPGASG